MENLGKLVLRTISNGAPLYNEGKKKECYEVYLGAAQYACQQESVQNVDSIGPMLEQAVADAKELARKQNYRGAAWALRSAFDEIIAQSSKKKKVRKIVVPIRENAAAGAEGAEGDGKQRGTTTKKMKQGHRVPPRWRKDKSPKRERVFPHYDESPRKPSQGNLTLQKAPMKPTRKDVVKTRARTSPTPEMVKILEDSSGSMAGRGIESADLEIGAEKAPPTKEPTKPTPLVDVDETSNMERAAFVLAFVSVASSVGSMVYNPSTLMFVTGTLAGIMGPVTYWQQRQLTDARALIEAHNALERELQTLLSSKEQLKNNMTELAVTVEKLEDLRECQAAIAESQEASVVVLETQLAGNKRILKNKQLNLKGVVLQNIFSVANTFPHRQQPMTEKERLEQRDKLLDSLTEFGQLEIHHERFKSALSCQCFACVNKVAQNLLRDDTPDDKRIFTIKDE